MVGTPALLGLSVLLCGAASVASKCRVGSVRVVGSFSTTCDIQFGYTTAPPDWIDQLQVVESFRNATDEQLDAFAKDACRCRMLRVHRHCPRDLFELIRGVAWRCFPGARGEISRGIAGGRRRDEHLPGLRTSLRGIDDGDQGVQDSLQTTEEKDEAEVEGTGTEYVPTSDSVSGNNATNGTLQIENGEDENGDVTSVGSVDVPTEESIEDGLEIVHDSSNNGTEQSTAFEGIDREDAEKGSGTVPEDNSGADSEDTTEEPAGGSTEEVEDETVSADTGSGEELKEVYEDEGSTGSLDGSDLEETSVSSPPVP